MPDRTRVFARVIGPFMTIVISIIEVRVGEMGGFLTDLFANKSLVWMMGALLLFCGLLIIAFHQLWSSAAAIAISLFGWFLTLRGVVLLAAPQLIARGAASALTSVLAVRLGFGVLLVVGAWLTWVGWRRAPVPRESAAA